MEGQFVASILAAVAFLLLLLLLALLCVSAGEKRTLGPQLFAEPAGRKEEQEGEGRGQP